MIGNPRKREIAAAQRYVAVMTRAAEVGTMTQEAPTQEESKLTKEVRKAKHGTPEEFEHAIWAAHAQLFITTHSCHRPQSSEPETLKWASSPGRRP